MFAHFYIKFVRSFHNLIPLTRKYNLLLGKAWLSRSLLRSWNSIILYSLWNSYFKIIYVTFFLHNLYSFRKLIYRASLYAFSQNLIIIISNFVNGLVSILNSKSSHKTYWCHLCRIVIPIRYKQLLITGLNMVLYQDSRIDIYKCCIAFSTS